MLAFCLGAFPLVLAMIPVQEWIHCLAWVECSLLHSVVFFGVVDSSQGTGCFTVAPLMRGGISTGQN